MFRACGSATSLIYSRYTQFWYTEKVRAINEERRISSIHFNLQYVLIHVLFVYFFITDFNKWCHLSTSSVVDGRNNDGLSSTTRVFQCHFFLIIFVILWRIIVIKWHQLKPDYLQCQLSYKIIAFKYRRVDHCIEVNFLAYVHVISLMSGYSVVSIIAGRTLLTRTIRWVEIGLMEEKSTSPRYTRIL